MEELIRNIDTIQIELETTTSKLEQSLKELKLKAATIQSQHRNGQNHDDTRFT